MKDICIDYDYDYNNVVQNFKDPHVANFVTWFMNVQLLLQFYSNDKESCELALKIAKKIGFVKFLKSRHDYDELLEFYESICNVYKVNC